LDLLDFSGGALYYDRPPAPRTAALLRQAADGYGEAAAEAPLREAAALQPDHLEVLVALYRYHYYHHDYAAALGVAERALGVAGRTLGLPADWRGLDQLPAASAAAMPLTRFYLLALKGAGYLELRLGRLDQALERLYTVARLDREDRLGAAALIRIAEQALAGGEH